MTAHRMQHEHFWPMVQAENGTDCWLWTGTINQGGYGQFYADGRTIMAHRHAYELAVGPIPDGMTIDHLCVNPPCVNPGHLEPVTQGENTLRGYGVSGINIRKTHCIRGHEFSLENTDVNHRGHRACKQCKREQPAIRVACEICGKVSRRYNRKAHLRVVHGVNS